MDLFFRYIKMVSSTLLFLCILLETSCQDIIRVGGWTDIPKAYKYGFCVRDAKHRLVSHVPKKNVIDFVKYMQTDSTFFRTRNHKIIAPHPIEDSTNANMPTYLYGSFKVVGISVKKHNYYVQNNHLKRTLLYAYDIEPDSCSDSIPQHLRAIVFKRENWKKIKLGHHYEFRITPLLLKDCCNPDFYMDGGDTIHKLRQSQALYTYVIKGVLVPNYNIRDYNIVDIEHVSLISGTKQKYIFPENRANR